MTVSQLDAPPPGEPEAGLQADKAGFLTRFGGIIAPIITVILAFFVSGIVVLVTTKSVDDTLETYRAVFRGTGLSWFVELGNHDIGLPLTDARVWFPWNTDDIASLAASNLQQTLILWTALVLTGLAVAFAFRCGLFNIGGQGQYLAGSIGAVLVAPATSARTASNSRYNSVSASARIGSSRPGSRTASSGTRRTRSPAMGPRSPASRSPGQART